MKLATWNVNSINVRLDHALKWLKATGTEVLCLQETKSVDENFPVKEFERAGYNSSFIGEKSYNGVALISKFEITNVQKNFPDDDIDAPKRLIAADINGIHVVNTYIPNGTKLWSDKFDFKLDWLQRLRRYLDDRCDTEKDVLLCGDFNVAPGELDVWDVSKWEGKLHFSKPERAAMFHVMQWGFTDLFRSHHPEAREWSWWDFRTRAFERDQGLRIDHIWTSASLTEKSKDCWVDRDPRGWDRPSDHTPVVAEFDL
ncbi:MAG: exodeoxyribonuclease III [Acidobacteriota bacterium]|nr:exodeoxyribonuclease III [Acidobacteriota bacterium]MDH3528663.1 exodeoxyribonuclease III [Acidobacteriota bacterium]